MTELLPNDETTRRPGSSADIEVLRRNLQSRLEYAQLYDEILRGLVEREALSLVESFRQEELEAISRLAGLLRRLGYPPGTMEQPDERLIAQLRTRRGTLERLEFLGRGSATAARWYQERADDDRLGDDLRRLFAELAELHCLRRQRVADLIATLS